ncbi:MAG TPA: pyridoxal-phosphate dependent enzyme [Actinocrinis sp.]|nr:pyridoxal-phosphate dependent enzyme [Actinocrinis sp.]
MLPGSLNESALPGRYMVKAASERIAPFVRPVTLQAAGAGPANRARLCLAFESMQFSGSFKARGAVNFATYHLERGAMPQAGVVLGDPGHGNAALACAWAARRTGTRATVYVRGHVDRTTLARLHGFGATVHIAHGCRDDIVKAARVHATAMGALFSHPYDHPLTVAGAGTLAAEIDALVGSEIDTVMVPVGGGALLAGTCAALEHTGIRVVAVELEGRRALGQALAAADDAAPSAAHKLPTTTVRLARAVGCVPVPVSRQQVGAARRIIWEQWRMAVEPVAAMAFAAIQAGAYLPDVYENVVAVVTGANTNPGDLMARPRTAVRVTRPHLPLRLRPTAGRAL